MNEKKNREKKSEPKIHSNISKAASTSSKKNKDAIKKTILKSSETINLFDVKNVPKERTDELDPNIEEIYMKPQLKDFSPTKLLSTIDENENKKQKSFISVQLSNRNILTRNRSCNSNNATIISKTVTKGSRRYIDFEDNSRLARKSKSRQNKVKKHFPQSPFAKGITIISYDDDLDEKLKGIDDSDEINNA